MQQITETYKSSDGKRDYTTICHTDGRLACNCHGWATKKGDTVRTCWHCDDLVSKHNLITDKVKGDKGDYRTVIGGASGLQPKVPTPKAPKLPTVKAEPVQPKRRFNTIPEEEVVVLNPYVNPMLASLMPDLPNQKVATVLAAMSRYSAKDWVLEEKFDGHRVIVSVLDGVVTAWSRPKAGKEALLRTLPLHLSLAFSKFPNGTYDGELYVPGGVSTDVTDLSNEANLVFVVFDVLRLLGNDTTGNTLTERRLYLETIFGRMSDSVLRRDGIILAAQMDPTAANVQAIFDRKGEGAILKRRAARYQPGARSADWIKVKGLETCVMEVIGFKKGKLGPYATVELRNPVDLSVVTVKAKDNEMLRQFALNPTSFLGRRMLLEYQFRSRDGGYRHPRWDRWENE